MKDSKKEQMSVQKQIKYKKTLSGFAWVCAGVLELFDNKICLSLCVIILIIALVLTLDVSGSKKEKYDEMAIYNLTVARSRTLELLEFVIVLLAALLAILAFGFEVFNAEIPDITMKGQYIKSVVFIFMGAISFLVGINFHLLERE